MLLASITSLTEDAVSFTTGFIVEVPRRTSYDELVVSLRLPWMRSIPWSCVEEMTLFSEGHAPLAGVRLIRGSDEIPVRFCQSLGGYWTIGERIRLAAALDEEAARSAKLEVHVNFFLPYVSVAGRPPLLSARDSVTWAAPMLVEPA